MNSEAGTVGTPRKTELLRCLINSESLSFLCEAHNGLSATIVQEAGFGGVWGSGLTISAQLGVRDNNEASWTQVLEVVEFMADACDIPILLDGDTGYGNFNNLRRLVQKLEQRGVAGVCIEDKLFPKTNSFIQGETQALAPIEEFCGKIRAGKDAQRDDAFVIVARVEAFIAGLGLEEALRRAEAYHAAGADAILIHSSLRVPDEVLAFKREWGDRLPVVIVPTKYYSAPTSIFREYGFSMVIWANHLLRAAVKAMKGTAQTIMSEENLLSVEDAVVSVGEIFRLQGAAELQDAEARFLPKAPTPFSAVILAAARGEGLGALTEERPKSMVDVRGRSILHHITSAYRSIGIKDITVVRGYKKETVTLGGIRYVDNDEFATTGEAWSLECALANVDLEGNDRLVVSYGDVLFHKYIPEALLDMDEDFVVVLDTNWRESVNRGRVADYAQCSEEYSRRSFLNRVLLRRIDAHLDAADTHGEWMGFLAVSADALAALRSAVAHTVAGAGREQATVPDVINALIDGGRDVAVMYTTGHWLDIDTVDDVLAASAF